MYQKSTTQTRALFTNFSSIKLSAYVRTELWFKLVWTEREKQTTKQKTSTNGQTIFFDAYFSLDLKKTFAENTSFQLHIPDPATTLRVS